MNPVSRRGALKLGARSGFAAAFGGWLGKAVPKPGGLSLKGLSGELASGEMVSGEMGNVVDVSPPLIRLLKDPWYWIERRQCRKYQHNRDCLDTDLRVLKSVSEGAKIIIQEHRDQHFDLLSDSLRGRE